MRYVHASVQFIRTHKVYSTLLALVAWSIARQAGFSLGNAVGGAIGLVSLYGPYVAVAYFGWRIHKRRTSAHSED
jgi:hypothetical protein